jgi:hypothetical protein
MHFGPLSVGGPSVFYVPAAGIAVQTLLELASRAAKPLRRCGMAIIAEEKFHPENCYVR